MDFFAYEIESKVEQNHWWFKGRRYLFQKILSSFDIKNFKILDIGSSSGTNLRMLKEMGLSNYVGMDISEQSKHFCESKKLGEVVIGDAASNPFDHESFDLILMTDVLEHLDNDVAAIKECHRVLKKGGFMLCTVPLYMHLWGGHDMIAQHKRRYRFNAIKKIFQNNGFLIKKSFHFNFLLYLPILISRKIMAFFNVVKNENELNCGPINTILDAIFKIDVMLAPSIHSPFGVSGLILLQKN